MGTPTHFLNTPDLKLKGSFVIREKRFQNLNSWSVTRRHSLINIEIKQMIFHQVHCFQLAELVIAVADLD